MKKKISQTLTFLLITTINFGLKSQDLIIKTNNDTIKAKVTEVGTNAVSFKKWNNLDGPNFVENKSNIALIKYSNGQIETYSKSIGTLTNSALSNTAIPTNSLSALQSNTAIPSNSLSAMQSNTSIPTNSAIATNSAMAQQGSKIKIERVGSKYTINGQKASRSMVNDQLSQSKNPLIAVPLKGTKLMGGAQKIVKLTSIPSTIGGGFTFLWKGIDMWNDIQRGRANTQSYVNAALSLVGTLTLPITNKILKKKSNKMYDKLINIYNETN